MADPISPALLEDFSGFLARRTGLHFPRDRWPDMLRQLQRAALCHDSESAGECMRRLLDEPFEGRRLDALVSCLTVGETCFYREAATFVALEIDVLPELISARRAAGQLRLSVWSAGCCTGEEIYSVAVLLNRLIPDIDQWNVVLLGTDINPDFLAKAERAEYRQWSFRGTPAWFRERYFTASGKGTCTLVPHIRRLVRFARQNLVDDTAAFEVFGMDVVLCRNVLMYFEPKAVRIALDRLRGALVDGGWLVISATDASPALLTGFTPVGVGHSTLYRKTGGKLPPPAKPRKTDAVPAPAQGGPVVADYTLPSGRSSPLPAVQRADGANVYHEANACYKRGDYAAAVELLAATAPDDVPALALAAHACASLGQLEEAQRWCAAAVSADKVAPGLRYLLASILIERGQDEAAAVALGQALYLDPDHALAHFALGNLYRRLGPPARAAKHFANARALLTAIPPDQPLPDGEGLAAGRLLAIIDQAEYSA